MNVGPGVHIEAGVGDGTVSVPFGATVSLMACVAGGTGGTWEVVLLRGQYSEAQPDVPMGVGESFADTFNGRLQGPALFTFNGTARYYVSWSYGP